MGKACSQCKQVKPVEDFYKHKLHKDGLNSRCKTCDKEKDRLRYKNNPERKKQNRKYSQNNKDKIKERQKIYRKENKEQLKEKRKKYYKENKEYENERNKKYQTNNYEIIREQRKKFRNENKERLCIEQKEYRQDNNEIIKERKRNAYNPDKKRRYDKENEEQQKKWRHENKEKIKERGAIWSKTKSGRESNIKKAAKRRGKKWILILPNIFPEDIPVHSHHVDGNWFVAPLPSILHTGGKNMKQHIEQSNEWIEFYYGLNPISILQENVQ